MENVSNKMQTTSIKIGDEIIPPEIIPPETIPPETIPPGFEFFGQFEGKSAVEIISLIFPKFAEAIKSDESENVIGAFAGLFWGAGLDLGASLPEFAKKASEKYWQSSGLDFLINLEKLQSADLGNFVEFMNLMPISGNDLSPETTPAIKNVVQSIKMESANLSADELKKYADARVATPNKIEKLKNPSERLLVFLIIACAWRQIAALGSQAKTHQWLLDHKIISPNTDRGETSRFFREIGLPTGKSGRPKKNTDTVKIG
ncbi:MAG: hypothetical protein P4N60_08885 [Verrucomicrobiae bacterium]|nr:hypothetical protein [Verrucomicrobiae bacterium]